MKTQIKSLAIIVALIFSSFFISCSNDTAKDKTSNTDKNSNTSKAISLPQLEIVNNSPFNIAIGCIFAQTEPGTHPDARIYKKGVGNGLTSNSGIVPHNSTVKYYDFMSTSDNANLQPTSWFVTDYLYPALSNEYDPEYVNNNYGYPAGNNFIVYWSGLLIEPFFAPNNTNSYFDQVNSEYLHSGLVGDSDNGPYKYLYNTDDSFEFTKNLKIRSIQYPDTYFLTAKWLPQPNGDILLLIQQ